MLSILLLIMLVPLPCYTLDNTTSLILCELCIETVKVFKKEAAENPHFKEEQKKTCDELKEKYNKTFNCESLYIEEVVKKLNVMEAVDICKEEKLCKKGFKLDKSHKKNQERMNLPPIPKLPRLNGNESSKDDLLKRISDVIERKTVLPGAKNATIHLNLNFKVPGNNETTKAP